MRAPARLHEAPSPHSANGAAVGLRRNTICPHKAQPFCYKVQAPPQLKTLMDVRSHRCTCHAQQPNDNRTTDEASTSKRLSPATRQQIFTNCSAVSAAFVAVAAAIRRAAPVTGPYLFRSDQSAVQSLLQSMLLRLNSKKQHLQKQLACIWAIRHRFSLCVRLQLVVVTTQTMLWSHWQQQA